MVKIRLIHDRCNTDVKGIRIELFEAIGQEKPFRVRSVDIETGEVGPNIMLYEHLSDAARFYEKYSPIW